MWSQQAMKAYHQADREAAAESENPHELVSVLFDELIRRMEAFRATMVAGNYSTERGFTWGSAGGGKLAAWLNALEAVDEARRAGK